MAGFVPPYDMQPRHAIAEDGLRVRRPGRSGEVEIAWERLLAVRAGRGGPRIVWLGDDGTREGAALPAATRTELEEIQRRWSQALEARAHQLGAHEGTAVGEPSRAETVVMAGLLLASVGWVAWLVLSHLHELSATWEQLQSLPAETSSAVTAVAGLVAAGVALITAVMVSVLLRMLRLRAVARRWARWRVGPDGLARAGSGGAWRQVDFEVRGDRLRTTGGAVPLCLLSGDGLTRRLLVALASRRGRAFAGRSRLGPALRLVVWPVLLWAGAWAAFCSLGMPLDRQVIALGLATSLVLAVAVAGLLLAEDLGERRQRAGALAQGQALLERLEW